ncbi:hypothetical protein PHYBOEH_008477 [Phytophthora boehmeriae]|uniref:Cilia- and flagella-associated protein 69 ARM repeats domain-containing protein n=1 Tax=Phytophthora boehmeriae TaxID=109152 RepID=A0A8T1X808_9STRA|nr:hypothetical protein PHYBOEH_008477 [Phytophthora boehmeriae]
MTSRRQFTSSSSSPTTASQRVGSATTVLSPESFLKLFASVDDPQTQNNHARHLALTKNILYENELGWKVADLPFVSDLLQLLRNKVLEDVPQFNEQLVLATMRCSKPFIRQKSNEEITNPSLLHGLLPTLGELLSFNDIDVQVAAAESLRVFATGACLPRPTTKTRSNNAESKDDLRMTPRIFSQSLMEETGAVDAIVAVMHELFPDEELEGEEQQYLEELEAVEYALDPTEEQSSEIADNNEISIQGSVQHEEMKKDKDASSGELVATTRSVDDIGSVSEPSVDVLVPAKPASALPKESNNFAEGDGDLDEHKQTLGVVLPENDTSVPQQDQAPTHTSKPSSAPAINRHADAIRLKKSSSAPGVANRGSHVVTEQHEEAPEAPEALPLSSDPAQECPTTEAGNSEEEISVVGTDNALPVQIRLSVLLFPLIDLIYEISSFQQCAEVLVVSGALHYIVLILENITDPQDELLPLCLEIMWNVLELSHEKISSIPTCVSRKELLETFRLRNAMFFLGNEFTFYSLLHVLELLLAQGYRQQDKEMRNECLMILQLLAKRRRSLDFFYSTGLTACLFSYATSAELSLAKPSKQSEADKSSATASAITANNQYYATNSDEDFEFKQMLWILLAEISCDHQSNLRELVQFKFVEVWLSYVTATRGSSNQQETSTILPRVSTNKYSAPQLQILQCTALSMLNHVVPFVLEHFYEMGGHVKLLEFLQLNTGSEDVLASAWLLMLQASPPIPFFQTELGMQGIVNIAVEIFEKPPSTHSFAIRRNAILTCASVCRNDNGSNRERFLRANGVRMLVENLEFDPSHSILEENILIGVVDAVRSCVIGYAESESAFINDDGIPKLLSILGLAPKALKHQVLAALSEICVNPAAIPSYQAWRSDQHGEDNNASATQMLLRIYACEEAAEQQSDQSAADKVPSTTHKVNRPASTNARQSAFQSVTVCRSPSIIAAPNNVISPEYSFLSRSNRPQSPAFARLKEALIAAQNLTPEKQAAHSILQLENNEIHPEVNLKSRIYAVLEKVSFACEDENLKPQEQVVLEVAKEYPTFKLGEMWQDVERAVHAEGVRPIYADALYMRKNIEHAYNVSVCTKLARQEVFARSHQQSTKSEKAFFEQILRQKHQEAQAEQFHRTNRRQNSTMQLHLDAKKTRLEFMRRQDPTAFAAYENEERCLIRDPPPEYEDDQEGWQRLQQNEAELRGRLTTITHSRKHSV